MRDGVDSLLLSSYTSTMADMKVCGGGEFIDEGFFCWGGGVCADRRGGGADGVLDWSLWVMGLWWWW